MSVLATVAAQTVCLHEVERVLFLAPPTVAPIASGQQRLFWRRRAKGMRGPPMKWKIHRQRGMRRNGTRHSQLRVPLKGQ